MNYCKELKSLLNGKHVHLGVIISLAIISVSVVPENTLHAEAVVLQPQVNKEFSSNIVDEVIDISNLETLDTITDNIQEQMEQEDQIIVIDSHDIPVSLCQSVGSREVTINIDYLYEAYANAPTMEFDYKNKYRTINCLWEFLYNQNHIDPIITSAIIGNIAMEGDFGLQQGTQSNQFKSIEDCRTKLGNKQAKGYGLIQWTYSTRKLPLLQFYEDAYNKLHTDNFTEEDWTKVMLSAECTYLMEEVNAWGIFQQYEALPERDSIDKLLESAVGLLCREFVGYQNNNKQWSKSNGSYYLCDSNGSGKERLDYARAIYSFYINN